MSLKQKLIISYIGFGFIFAIYSWMFGDTAHKSFMFNLGQGLVWPAVMFPVIGQAIGGILLVLFVAFLTLS